MADDLEGVVKKNVKALQEAQDKMDKGKQCKNAGQSGVAAAEKTLKQAQGAQTKAQLAYDKAANADVDFGTKKLSTLDKSKCEFFNDAAYLKAVANRKKKQDALNKAKGAVASATKGLDNAKEAAKKAVLKCKCDTFNNHETSMGKRNSDAEKANKKGWTMAAHLKCVLKGETTSKCKVPAIPKVVGAKGLCKGCDKSACTKYQDEYGPDKIWGKGVLKNIDQSLVTAAGYKLCVEQNVGTRRKQPAFNDELKANCKGTRMVVACGPKGSKTLSFAAAGEKAKILKMDTGSKSNSQLLHKTNIGGKSVGWFNSNVASKGCFGFTTSSTMHFNNCDGSRNHALQLHANGDGYKCGSLYGSKADVYFYSK